MKSLVKYWPVLLILGLSVFIIWPLFLPGYFSHHDNIQVIRIYEMARCFQDGQIPCRWVPDMGYGYGYPLFNYYGVFPYYLGGFLSVFLGYVGAAKALFFIPLVLGGISMYLLGRELFQSKMAGFLAGTLFLFAPYRALDAYVRGAIAESFAIAIIPLVFYFSLKLIRGYSGFYFFATALSLGIFLTNHNIMTLYFIPVLFLWIIYFSIEQKSKNIAWVALSIGLGIGMACFYLIPSYFEKNLVQIENLLESEFIPNFRAHFVTLRQLFTDRFWGYGASTWLEEDGISFQVGWPHWWLAAVIMFLGLANFMAKIKLIPAKISSLTWTQTKLIILLSCIFIASLLMTHNKSAFIWEEIDTLHYSQFPWRFLSVSIFTVSLLGGSFILLFKQRLQIPITIVLTVATIFLNWQYFIPEKFFYSQNDEVLLSGDAWDFQRKGAILDYLPKGALEPKQPAPSNPQIISGEAEVKNFINKSNFWQFEVSVLLPAKIEVPVFDFPNWTVYLNGEKISHGTDNLFHRIDFQLEKGNYKVSGKFMDTPIRTVSNMLTIFSMIALLYLATYGKNKFRKP